jgi:hypothetical protein
VHGRAWGPIGDTCPAQLPNSTHVRHGSENALAADFSNVEVLPIEHDLFRFYA